MHPGENVLTIPLTYDGQAMLWQQEAGFGFRMTGGYVRATIPAALWKYPIVRAIYGAPLPPFPGSASALADRGRKVDVVLLRRGRPGPWARVLTSAWARPRAAGGMLPGGCAEPGRRAGTRREMTPIEAIAHGGCFVTIGVDSAA